MQFGSRLFGSFGRAFVSPAVKVVLQSTALLALLALAGCPAASTAGNTNPPATPPSASTVVVQAISTTAFNSIDAGSLSLNATGSLGGASRIAYFGFIESQLIQADLALTLTSWTESTPSSY
ncbi:MAG TPA: hypothetical protein VL354_08590, partial [Spirochaetia bacterium]|nr:hypothetical protein [Spirochaetia bacterium]